MKRIAFLLAFIFVFSACVIGCENQSPDVSDSSDASAGAETSAETVKLSVITGDPVSENPHATVVSNGATYTKSFDADEKYPDTYDMELTDSIRSNVIDGNYGDTALCGFTTTTNIIVNLGTVYDKLYGFQVGYLSYNEAGINEPRSITVKASIDGEKWTQVGGLAKPEGVNGSVMTASIEAKGYFRAQYIRFDVVSQGAWYFLDEVSVIADIAATAESVQYMESVNSAYQTLGSVQKPSSDVAINRELDKVLISEGASYKVNGSEKNFKDSGKMLTDGILTGYYEGGTWVGYDVASDVTVTVDLKETVTDIAVIEASFFTNTAINVFLPAAVKIAAIDENDNRTELGILYGNTVISSGNYTFSLPFDNAISARYIEYTFVATPTNLVMIEELGIYAYREVEKTSMYPELVIEEGTTDWGEEGSDQYVNLIKGKTQQIVSANEPDDENIANNTKANSTLMTDGARAANTDIHNGRFFKFCLGGSRTVIYDLEHTSAVDKFTASFVERTDWAVQRPNKVLAYISPDGTAWYEVGEVELEGSGNNYIYKGELVLDKAVNAKYVAFSFDVGTWAGCDELEVFGTKDSSGVAPEALGFEAKNGFFSSNRIAPSEELLGGTKDLCLMYHSKNNYYVAEDLIPYIAYVDSEGNPQDLMFDNFLFLYNNTTFPSGGSPHTGSVLTDWQWTIEDLFTDGRNIMALEDAAGQVKSALGLAEDYKFMYSVTLYYPIKFDENGGVVAYNFGDVDEDGVMENTGNYEDRVKILQWYIDSIESIVAEKSFKNIELVGYYWWHEAIENVDKQGYELLNAISDMVHETGKDFFWIPYFTSNGYNQWADYGFDVACMQPNYVFRLEAPYSNVVRCAELTALYGMGFEMEISSDALTNILFYKKYMEYLGSGATLGYMNDTINMYYQSVTIFRDAARSDSVMARNIYDQTYHFIKGDLAYNPPAKEGLSFSDVQKNTVYTGDLGFTTEVPREFRVEVMPDHGTVTLNSDGTFTYYPEKDYTGEVKFSFSYNEYLGWSVPSEVTITVK